ncbi:MAG: Peptidase A2A [Rhodocyclaceae bacterium]|nr:MAG: Peptidase A2A [Rhodocyclaceae bacterium]
MGQQRFDPRRNIILVEARIEGKKNRWTSLQMALDTGASLTVIPWSAAEMLGLDPARSRRRVRFMTGSGMEAAPVLTVDAVEVLGVQISRVPVLCHDLPQRSLVDGLLGLSFLKHCRISVDFKSGILSIEPSRR